ncbi:unnamed protein product, partial [Allacma fusca]
LNDRL